MGDDMFLEEYLRHQLKAADDAQGDEGEQGAEDQEGEGEEGEGDFAPVEGAEKSGQGGEARAEGSKVEGRIGLFASPKSSTPAEDYTSGAKGDDTQEKVLGGNDLPASVSEGVSGEIVASPTLKTSMSQVTFAIQDDAEDGRTWTEGSADSDADPSDSTASTQEGHTKSNTLGRAFSVSSLAIVEDESHFKSEPVTGELLSLFLQREAQDPRSELQMSLCGRVFQQSGELGRREQHQLFDKHIVGVEEFMANPLDISSNPELYVRVNSDIYRWQLMAPAVLSALFFGRDLHSETHQQMVALDNQFSLFKQDHKMPNLDVTDGGDPDILMGVGCSGDDDFERITSDNRPRRTKMYTRKTLFPNQEQLKSLPLREGANSIRFYLSKKASSPPVTATIYLWNSKSKVVISDVDGTITKSDVLGHMLPRVGILWAQKGVPQLMTNIRENNYKVLYLTARPIGAIDQTKNYLQSVQEDGVHLPVGPVITSPDGLFKSLNREVIQRKPEEFKIECLGNLKKLFPNNPSPFYAGFGNRPTDVVSYQAVQVPDSRIFIINPQGEIHCPLNQNMVFQTGYEGLRELVDLMFPPISEDKDVTDEQFNSFNFWKVDPFSQIADRE